MKKLQYGLGLLAIIIALSLLVPWLSPYSNRGFDANQILQHASMKHWLGTDAIGRDYTTLLFKATALTLGLAFYCAIISLVIAVTVSVASAGSPYRWVDHLLMRLAELINALPLLPMAITASAWVSFKSSDMQKIYLALTLIGIISWPPMAIILRGLLLKLKKSDTILYARSVGYSSAFIYWRYYLPEVRAMILVHGSRLLSRALMAESALSFLSFGVTEPSVSLGLLLSYAKNYDIMANYPYQWVASGLMLSLCALSFHLIADALSMEGDG